jgi:hypothetical protein
MIVLHLNLLTEVANKELLCSRPTQLYILCLCFQVLLHLIISAPRINYFVCSGAIGGSCRVAPGRLPRREAADGFISFHLVHSRYLFKFHFFYLKGLSHGRDLAFDDMYG